MYTCRLPFGSRRAALLRPHAPLPRASSSSSCCCSDALHLGRLHDGVCCCQLLALHRLVVKAAVVRLGVAVRPAEQLPAAALEAREAHLLAAPARPAAGSGGEGARKAAAAAGSSSGAGQRGCRLRCWGGPGRLMERGLGRLGRRLHACKRVTPEPGDHGEARARSRPIPGQRRPDGCPWASWHPPGALAGPAGPRALTFGSAWRSWSRSPGCWPRLPLLRSAPQARAPGWLLRRLTAARRLAAAQRAARWQPGAPPAPCWPSAAPPGPPGSTCCTCRCCPRCCGAGEATR